MPSKDVATLVEMEPSADLEYVESSDESVGYRDGQYLCPKCRPRRKP